MRTQLWMLLPALLWTGCETEDTTQKKKGIREGAPSEDFQYDDSVQLLMPTNGETVGSPFNLVFLAGADVQRVRVEADGVAVRTTEITNDQGRGELLIMLDEGRYELGVIALGEGDEPLSSQEITIRVDADGEQWVTLTSPADGANVTNPVTFAVDASSSVESIELSADGWTLGTITADSVLTWEFSGTGYEREIEATGFDDQGEIVATDAITITIEPGTEADPSDYNDVVLELLEGYALDGSHGYYWPSGLDWLGNTQDLRYLGTLLSAGDPEGRCYCVGLTLEVFLRAFDQIDKANGGDGSLNGISLSEMDEFIADWFVRDLWGRGIVDAMENYGIGDPITDWDDVEPGDIVQFWRHSGSGHNNIFIEWERDADDAIIGLTYWSTQSSTDGIGYNTEYFGGSGSRIDPNHFFVGRVRMPEDWDPWY